jgi:hypothetical protein
MNLPTLRPEQHSAILGYAAMGYGISFAIGLVDPIVKANTLDTMMKTGLTQSRADLGFDFGDLLFPKVVFGIAVFVICTLAGFVIKSDDLNPRPLGLLLALLTFGFFPLGTLVSMYTLLYLFAIYKHEEPINQVKLN